MCVRVCMRVCVCACHTHTPEGAVAQLQPKELRRGEVAAKRRALGLLTAAALRETCETCETCVVGASVTCGKGGEVSHAAPAVLARGAATGQGAPSHLRITPPRPPLTLPLPPTPPAPHTFPSHLPRPPPGRPGHGGGHGAARLGPPKLV